MLGHCKCGCILNACDDPNVVSGYVEYEHDAEDWFGLNICKFMVRFNYWRSAQSRLSNEGLMGSYCLTQDGLGKDNHFLSIILYFVVDMLFKTNGRICFLKINKNLPIVQNPKPYQNRVCESGMLNAKAIIVVLMCITKDTYKAPYQVF